jgi:SNF2 family DNA or RNA helicase
MKVLRYHGKDRLNDLGKIDGTNILLTTYQTVSADWKKGKSSGSTPLFSVQWRRIILDEGSYE